MDDQSKRFPFPMVGDADPIPASLFMAYPEQATTLALLYEVSRELTSILDREELLRRVAQDVKKLVNYHVFSVMLWNEKTQRLESVFAMRFGDTIPARMSLALHQGLTGTAAGERRILRVNDTLEDPRYIKCDIGFDTRSELVVPLLLQDRLVAVPGPAHTETNAFPSHHERPPAT